MPLAPGSMIGWRSILSHIRSGRPWSAPSTGGSNRCRSCAGATWLPRSGSSSSAAASLFAKDSSLASAGVLHHRGDRAELAPRGERGAGTGGRRRVRRVGRLASVPRARVDRRGTAGGVDGRRARRRAGGAPRRRRAELRTGGPPDHGQPRAAERPAPHVGRLLRRVPAPPVGPSGRRRPRRSRRARSDSSSGWRPRSTASTTEHPPVASTAICGAATASSTDQVGAG